MPTVTIIKPITENENGVKLRVAAYCRVSSDSADQLNSYMAQMTYYSGKFENSETEILVDLYADEGISGTRDDKRAEFQRMISDCRKGKIDRIYTKSISRFSRNTKDCLKNIRELKALGISVFFEKENLDTAKITDEIMITVAAYCRVSTELEEQQNSYQVQIEYYTNLIHQNKEWSLAGIFADEGISGTQTKKRTEFNRMIRLCKQKKIDLILCKSISRFARNTVVCLEYVRQLKDIGIGIIFEKENINTLTMTSEFMIALYGSFAQAESESISKNITLGNQMAFREGKARYQYKYWLGYRKGSDGNPEIVDDEAETVKLIYRMFLNDDSMQKIAEFLIQHNRKTALGELDWNHITVKRILTNEKYTGDCILQKTYTLDCITHKQVWNNGERAMYLVSDAHPAIIDRDTFNLAQQEIARRTSKRKVSSKTTTEQGKYSSKYALTELLVCGEC